MEHILYGHVLNFPIGWSNVGDYSRLYGYLVEHNIVWTLYNSIPVLISGQKVYHQSELRWGLIMMDDVYDI